MSAARESRNRQLTLLAREGALRREPVAQVALDLRTRELRLYAVPSELAALVAPGVAVRVPFGSRGRLLDGVCVRVDEQPWELTRPAIAQVLTPTPLLSERLIQLGLWLSEYYACPPGLALAAMTPALLRKPRTRMRKPRATQLAAEAPPALPDDPLELTAAQSAALQAVVSCAAFRVFVLYGVPGSGKTEVYVRAIRSAIASGRQAILLAPEIALATQVMDRLTRRFERVAVLHSRLTASQRRSAFDAIAQGRIDLVIGTRTAVFAPCPRLGLIVVDEEQDASYKNLASPYFHTRDVAIKRAQLEAIPAVLGSATPSLETWHNATHLPHFQLLRLAQRVPGAQPPRARAVQIGGGQSRPGRLLSAELAEALRASVEAGAQAVLLHNRRGHSVWLSCSRCGLLLRCTRCGAALVDHRREDALKCHRCGKREPRPRQCLDNSCRGELQRGGLAIQRLEEEVRELLPGARLLRLDRDTMRRREDYLEALRRFEAHAADVLLGTQMVAKGLDFPLVNLVGVIDADAGANLQDFRAAERTFVMLMQVVGRAGRRAGDSLALLQTREPRSPLIQQVLRGDYAAFAASELRVRAALHEPPFMRLTRVVLSDARPGRAREESEQLVQRLRVHVGRLHAGILVDEAAPCLVQRARGLQRYEVRIRTPRDASVHRLLLMLEQARQSPRVQRWVVDVDAQDLA